MGIALVDAVRLAKANKSMYETLAWRHERVVERCAAETAAQDRARNDVYVQALTPFRDVFSAIKNVDLAELATFEELPVGVVPSAEVKRVRLSATSAVGVLIGGAAGGAAVGAGTFAAVGVLATASTGVAISSLSGAAATSATLAWLGGGSIAAGGGGVALGTTVLTGVVAAPVVLALVGFAELKGRQQRRHQLEVALQLGEAYADLECEEARVDAVLAQSAQVRSITRQLRNELSGRLVDLGRLVERSNDYAAYTPADRRLVAQTATLATTIVCVLKTQFVTADGSVNELSRAVTADAGQRLEVLQHS